MEKRLKDMLKLSDESLRLCDVIRKNKDLPYEDFKIMLQHRELLIQKWMEYADGYMPVITTEECFVNPGQTLEIPTNISELPINSIEENKILEFTHEGIISTYGKLSFKLKKDYENGNKILVTNNIPEDYKGTGCFENPTSTDYYWTGIYMIEKNRMIGMIGFDPEKLKGENPLLEEETIKRTRKLFKNHIEDIYR